MKAKAKDWIVVIGFLALVIGLSVVNLLLPDKDISTSERRKLEQFPALETETFLSGEFFSQFEDYALDQFVFRDSFRTMKSVGRFYLLRLRDNNDIYLLGDGVYKMEYPLSESSVIGAAEKLNDVKDRYLQDISVYYSVIPDKNYFVAKEHGYLSYDYEKMLSLLDENLGEMTYLDLFPKMQLEDYYRTDLHWMQQNITDVAKDLLTGMHAKAESAPESVYETTSLSPFYGAFYGQSALPAKPDTLSFLENDITKSATVYDMVEQEEIAVYTPDLFDGIDPYDVYLGGARALLRVDNPQNPDGKVLYLFRDSFGSSIAPLLLEGYRTIYLIDLRYLATDYVKDYLEFEPGNDALFLYGTSILNQSAMLK